MALERGFDLLEVEGDSLSVISKLLKKVVPKSTSNRGKIWARVPRCKSLAAHCSSKDEQLAGQFVAVSRLMVIFLTFFIFLRNFNWFFFFFGY